VISRSYRIARTAIWVIVNGMTDCDQNLTWEYIVGSEKYCFLQQSFSSHHTERVKERQGEESRSFLCRYEGARKACSGFVSKTA